MSHPCPHHCPSGRGSGGVALAVVVVTVAALAALAKPAEHAAAELGRVVTAVFEVVAITVAAAVALAVVAFAAALVVRHRRQLVRVVRPLRLVRARQVPGIPITDAPAVGIANRAVPAIEPARAISAVTELPEYAVRSSS